MMIRYTGRSERGVKKCLTAEAEKACRTLKIEDQTVQTTLKFPKSPAPGRRTEKADGELAHQQIFTDGFRAAKARSASGRPGANDAERRERRGCGTKRFL